MEIKMKKVHIFDLDGTLIDSMTQFPKANLRVLEEEGITPPEDVVNIITPLGYRGAAEYFIKTLGVKASCPEEIMKRVESYLIYDYTNNIPLKPFVKEYVIKLKKEGFKLYVLTASPHSCTDACLKRNGIFDLFDTVWSSDDFGITKANPEIYRMAAERIGCNIDDIMFYDDNFTALETAKKAGLTVAGVFDPASDDFKEKIVSISDRYVVTFEELMK
jgi:HAD superfamily hydrolase (TIGR01509 family)